MKKINNILAAFFAIVMLGVSIAVIVRGTQVPIHWGLSSEPDSYGSCWSVVTLVIIEIFTFIGLVYLQRHPRLYNIPWKLKDKKRGAEIVSEIVGWLNATVALNMAYLAVCVYVGKFFFVGLIIIWAIFFTILFFKNKELKKS